MSHAFSFSTRCNIAHRRPLKQDHSGTATSTVGSVVTRRSHDWTKTLPHLHRPTRANNSKTRTLTSIVKHLASAHDLSIHTLRTSMRDICGCETRRCSCRTLVAILERSILILTNIDSQPSTATPSSLSLACSAETRILLMLVLRTRDQLENLTPVYSGSQACCYFSSILGMDHLTLMA